MSSKIMTTISSTDALVIIDVQHDFLPGGSLAVPSGDEIFPVINELAKKFDNVILTQDWHPADHKSFASVHDREPFSMTEMDYGPQVLWPDHCVQGTHGAEIALENWIFNKAHVVIRKGYRPSVDSYSAFFENDKKTSTGLAGWLNERGIKRLFFVGLATDYCVGFSAIDAKNIGFNSVVLLEGCRGIAPESINERIKEMKDAGVTVVDNIR